MIETGLGPTAPDSSAFLALGGLLVLIAWSPWKRLFPAVLGLCSLGAAATWLDPASAAVLAVFVLAPYPLIRLRWGRGDRAPGRLVPVLILWQVGLFALIKGHPGIVLGDLLGHPVAVIGVSYIMFRQIALLVDAPYSGDQPFGINRYLTFLLAFWTLIAGPIQTYAAFNAGLARIGRPAPSDALRHMHRAVNGLIKAFLIAPLFLEPSRIGGLLNTEAGWVDLAVVFYGYPVYLYLNFSGYMDLVIGLAKLCGVDSLPENFDRPYLARNTQDFWTRWHISLGVWIRHYLFMPLTKTLVSAWGPARQGPALIAAVTVTFLLVGLWHGPTSNFVVFGLLQALGIVAVGLYGRLLKSWIPDKARRKAFAARPLTTGAAMVLSFHFTCFSFLFLENGTGDVIAALTGFFAR